MVLESDLTMRESSAKKLRALMVPTNECWRRSAMFAVDYKMEHNQRNKNLTACCESLSDSFVYILNAGSDLRLLAYDCL